jgi:hypothetical protein
VLELFDLLRHAVFEHHVGVGPVASHLAVRYENGRYELRELPR